MDALLKGLGFKSGERLAILHVDDIGMCKATLDAFSELWHRGAVSSGSVMTPCPWFPAVADWYAQHSDADLGVHITLTSEWPGYRWGPVVATAKSDNLVDFSGRYFHATTGAVCQHALVDAVNREMQGQIALAQCFGLQPSHIDNHMYTCFQPQFLAGYLELSISNSIPVLVTREVLNQLDSNLAKSLEQRLDDEGIPLFECIAIVKPCSSIEEYNAELKSIFANLPFGLTCILLHPAIDSGELRNIVTNWRYRVIEYQALLKNNILSYAADAGVKIVNYKHLKSPTTVWHAAVSGSES